MVQDFKPLVAGYEKALKQAESQLGNIEASLKRVITQIENSSIDTSTKCGFVADLEEILTEVHHLVPVEKPPLKQPINELGWSQRTVNTLRRRLGTYPDGRYGGLSIPTLGEVAMLSDKELLAIRNFGSRCLAEVKGTLESLSV